VNKGGGFSQTPTSSPSLEATYQAIMVLKSLGLMKKFIEDIGEAHITTFILQFLDNKDLFVDTDNSSNIVSTLQAVASLAELNMLHEVQTAPIAQAIIKLQVPDGSFQYGPGSDKFHGYYINTYTAVRTLQILDKLKEFLLRYSNKQYPDIVEIPVIIPTATVYSYIVLSLFGFSLLLYFLTKSSTNSQTPSSIADTPIQGDDQETIIVRRNHKTGHYIDSHGALVPKDELQLWQIIHNLTKKDTEETIYTMKRKQSSHIVKQKKKK